MFRQDHTLLLARGNILDPVTRTIRVADLLIRGGRIVEVSTEPLAGTGPVAADETINLSGKWVIPGLVDMHVHAWGNPSPTSKDGERDQDLGTEAVTQLVLHAGVTGLLDLGSLESLILPLRDKLRTVVVPHAELFASGPVFAQGRRRSGAGPRFVRDAADARNQVSELVARQPDVIKVIYDHSGDAGIGSMSRAVLRAIVRAAHEFKLRAVVHIGTWQDARDATLAGADAVTHLYDDEPIPRDLPALMKKHGTWSIPTMAVQCDFATATSSLEFWNNRLLKAVTTPGLRADYADRANFNDRAKFWGEWQTDYCRVNDFPSLRALAEAGVPLLAGTDSGNLGTFEGYSLHRELALMVEAGVPPWQALAAATTLPGQFLGRSFGESAGNEANLVVLTASPIPDIHNTELISLVIVHGKVFR